MSARECAACGARAGDAPLNAGLRFSFLFVHRIYPKSAHTFRSNVAIQNNVIKGTLGASTPLKPPFALKLLNWLPVLRRIPARVIGLGFQPEHVDKAVIP